MNLFSNGLDMNFLSSMLVTMVAVAISITVHEFGHALAAYLLGDKTAKYDGRLSLDPKDHIDIMGLICFAILGFGWAKPVHVDSNNFKNHKLGTVIVCLSGAIANVIMAIVCVYILKISNGMMSVTAIAIQTLRLNLSFAAFNLLPIPPLDGWGVISSLLPYKYREFAYKYESMGMMVLLICLLTNVHMIFVGPIYNFLWSIVSIFMM